MGNSPDSQSLPAMPLEEIRALIRDVADFPKPGIIYKDITPLLSSPRGLGSAVDHLAAKVAPADIDALLAIESRGFIFGAALAQKLSLPMHLVRKRGKLPRESISVSYSLEYGVDHLEIHRDAIQPEGRYLIVDDLLATGGTAGAVVKLVRENGGMVVACAVVIELKFLNGRKTLGNCPVLSVLTY